MKIIKPSAVLMRDFDGAEVMKFLELCGRTAYQSAKNITDDSAKKFIRNLIKRGHESVLEHFSCTFKIICDRGVMAELTRHRHASFTVESTRYIKCDELKFIEPDYWVGDYLHIDKYIRGKAQIQRSNWFEAVQSAEDNYLNCLTGGKYYRGCGMPPEIARAVLPLCLATELYMTANLREWRHILKLRTAKDAHPQMRQVAEMILAVLKRKLPVIFEDIDVLNGFDSVTIKGGLVCEDTGNEK